MNNEGTLFEAYLAQHDGQAWAQIVATLRTEIHAIDRSATQIWFAFYPLALATALQKAEEPEKLAKKLVLSGRYELRDQIDDSHVFLYGHKFWPEVKAAIVEFASSGGAPTSLDLTKIIRELAGSVAQKIKTDESMLIGITAVAFMTLQQVGLAAFQAAPGKISPNYQLAQKEPNQILAQRRKDDSQGLFGFMRGARKEYSVCFNENDNAKFTLIHSQHLTTAAAKDKRDYKSQDPRCVAGEGPIPIECRSAACGTCWVGVIAGAEKLSEVTTRERSKIREFGYLDTDESRPLIRLACTAQAYGNVTLVIPPWNGIFGKFIRRERNLIEESEIANSN